MVWPFTKEVKESSVINFDYNPTINSGVDVSRLLTEQFKGEVESNKIKFPAELGEEHPFDFKEMETLYKKFGFFTAVVDKYVDFVVGPGFFIKCDDERAKEIIEDFMVDVNLDTLLRAWCKEALVKGNGFMEIGGSKKEGVKGLKVLNANYMYAMRDNKGVVKGYNQYKGAFDRFAKNKVINFVPENIAHIPFNVVGDCAYGQGIGYSSLIDVNNLLQDEKDMHTINGRKANAPLHAQLGKVDGDIRIIPKPEDVTAFGQKLEIMSSKTEWATDPLVNFKVIDFGNVGDKFASILEHDMAKLMYDYQIPPELMGMANIPEGMAKVRMDSFQRRIQSIQAELEKIIEEKIFKRVLNANDFDVHVEFEWGAPSTVAVESRMQLIAELIKSPTTSVVFKDMLESEMVNLLKLDKDEYEEMKNEEEELEREMERQQPLVPGQNQGFPQKPVVPAQQPPQPRPEAKADIDISEKCKSGKKKPPRITEIKKKINKSVSKIKNYEYEKDCPHCTESWDNFNTIEEWLGFNYKEYLGFILTALSKYDFEFIKAVNEAQIEAGYLTESQIGEVRKVLDNGFRKGESIKIMAEKIDKNVGLKDLYRMTDKKEIKLGAAGLPILAKSAEKRSMGIVRSEVTRMSNKGAEDFFADKGIKHERWVASYGDRTCPDCEALNNQIFEVYNHPELPLHTNCRCMLVPVEGVK